MALKGGCCEGFYEGCHLELPIDFGLELLSLGITGSALAWWTSCCGVFVIVDENEEE